MEGKARLPPPAPTAHRQMAMKDVAHPGRVAAEDPGRQLLHSRSFLKHTDPVTPARCARVSPKVALRIPFG